MMSSPTETEEDNVVKRSDSHPPKLSTCVSFLKHEKTSELLSVVQHDKTEVCLRVSAAFEVHVTASAVVAVSDIHIFCKD